MPTIKDCPEIKTSRESENLYPGGSSLTYWFKKLQTNIKSMRFNRHEISGSLGDMGIFIPLLVGMVSVNGLNIASALFFAGLFNIVTGVTFGIPMAVQPMKAIAAVAIND